MATISGPATCWFLDLTKVRAPPSSVRVIKPVIPPRRRLGKVVYRRSRWKLGEWIQVIFQFVSYRTCTDNCTEDCCSEDCTNPFTFSQICEEMGLYDDQEDSAHGNSGDVGDPDDSDYY